MPDPSTIAESEQVPLPVAMQDIELTVEAAERLTAIADNPDYPTHAGRRMPDADPHALTATPDTGVHPLWSEVQTLTARVRELEAERRMSLFVAGYHEDDTRPLESLVSEALAQKDNRIAELEATLARTDWRACPSCKHDWPHPSVTSGLLCPPCRYGPKLKKLEEENAYLEEVMRLADERLCDCANSLPCGSVCGWCSSTSDTRVGRTLKSAAERETENARLRSEVDVWKHRLILARMAMSATAKDEALPCRCGHEPYTDGEQCPKCFAIYQYEWMREATDEKPAEQRAYLCPYCNHPVYPYSCHEGPEACQEALRQMAARENG